jgi:hypothetical protein
VIFQQSLRLDSDRHTHIHIQQTAASFTVEEEEQEDPIYTHATQEHTDKKQYDRGELSYTNVSAHADRSNNSTHLEHEHLRRGAHVLKHASTENKHELDHESRRLRGVHGSNKHIGTEDAREVENHSHTHKHIGTNDILQQSSARPPRARPAHAVPTNTYEIVLARPHTASALSATSAHVVAQTRPRSSIASMNNSDVYVEHILQVTSLGGETGKKAYATHGGVPGVLQGTEQVPHRGVVLRGTEQVPHKGVVLRGTEQVPGGGGNEYGGHSGGNVKRGILAGEKNIGAVLPSAGQVPVYGRNSSGYVGGNKPELAAENKGTLKASDEGVDVAIRDGLMHRGDSEKRGKNDLSYAPDAGTKHAHIGDNRDCEGTTKAESGAPSSLAGANYAPIRHKDSESARYTMGISAAEADALRRYVEESEKRREKELGDAQQARKESSLVARLRRVLSASGSRES